MIQIIGSSSGLYCAILYKGSALIAMLAIFFLLGAIITRWILERMGMMIREKDEPETVYAKYIYDLESRPLEGKKVRLRLFSFKDSKHLTNWMNRMPERSILLLVRWLKFNYWFIFFFYPFLVFLVALLTHYTCFKAVYSESTWTASLIFIPVFAGLMDVFENLLATWSIEGRAMLNNNYVNLMRVFSFLKWIGLLVTMFIIARIIIILFSCS